MPLPEIISPVSPVTLARCFGVYARILWGATRYIRDETDTFSLMMSRLRADGVEDVKVINSYLAVQRFLDLEGLHDELFSYSHRVLFMSQVVSKLQTVDEQTKLPWMADPTKSALSAAWFTALASDAFHWMDNRDDPTQALFERLTHIARTLVQGGMPPFPDIDLEAVPEVEDGHDLAKFLSDHGKGHTVH